MMRGQSVINLSLASNLKPNGGRQVKEGGKIRACKAEGAGEGDSKCKND